MSNGILIRISQYLFTLVVQSPLWQLLESILSLRSDGPPRLESRNLLRVYIKTPTNQRTIPLELQLDWTVEDIKDQLRAILGIDDDLGIILAGRELANDVCVGNCDLSNMTILHAVQVIHKPSMVSKHQALNEELVDLQITGNDRQDPAKAELKAHFFVYCRHTDQSNLQVGKLRVRCALCQEGSVLIERDPCGWEDVLALPGRIQGHCLSGKCPKDLLSPVQFYFKCNDPQCSEDSREAPPLYQIRVNLMNVPCLACTESAETVLVFDCLDRHVICMDCFTTYVTSRLNERQLVLDEKMGYTLSCPVNCADSLVAEHKHLLAVLDRDDYDRYQRFAAEECVLQAGGVLCPHPRCGTGIIPDDPNERRIKCHQCHYVFCKECHQGFHIGACLTTLTSEVSTLTSSNSSPFDPDMISRARWRTTNDQKVDNSSLLLVRNLTKPCPKCRVRQLQNCKKKVYPLFLNQFFLSLLDSHRKRWRMHAYGMYTVPISMVLDLSDKLDPRLHG